MAVDALERELGRAVRAIGVDADTPVVLERARDPEHGDWASNVALTLARPLRRRPREIAEAIVAQLDARAAGVHSVEVAGPGFINFKMAPEALLGGLGEAARADHDYGRAESGANEPVVVEFVSANPTGPLHIGHGRQAALGDSISELLAWTGWRVQREYYYNDAGEQINRLARSVAARRAQLQDPSAPFPEDGYHGEYVTGIAERFPGPEATPEALRTFAVAELRAEQDRDLADFRVRFDRYFLESSLYSDGRVEDTIQRLRDAGYVYERDGALWLQTTAFGDDKDRVMVRSNGEPTYFLPDVAYHLTKWERGFHRAINVQGADHHGTTARVRAGLQALGLPEGYPEYVLHQMVTVLRGGQEVKFSKRAGDYVTLRELYTEVGVDVARYFFLMRRADAHLVFDLDLALDQSDKNPVLKIQYAHARMHAIFRRAGIAAQEITDGDVALLDRPAEVELAKILLRFPEVLADAAEKRAPHLMCKYLEDASGMVNAWYHTGNRDESLRVLVRDGDLSRARLLLCRAAQIVLRNGLRVLGISAPERMERAEIES